MMREKRLCWTVVTQPNGVNFWHTGAIRTSNAAWLVHTAEGFTLAFTLNSTGADPLALLGEIVPDMLDLLRNGGKRPAWW